MSVAPDNCQGEVPQDTQPRETDWLRGNAARPPDVSLQPIESAVAGAYGQIQMAGKGWRECTAAEKAIVILVEDGLPANQAVAVATVDALASTGAMRERVVDALLKRVCGIEDSQYRAFLGRVLLEIGRVEQ